MVDGPSEWAVVPYQRLVPPVHLRIVQPWHRASDRTDRGWPRGRQEHRFLGHGQVAEQCRNPDVGGHRSVTPGRRACERAAWGARRRQLLAVAPAEQACISTERCDRRMGCNQYM